MPTSVAQTPHEERTAKHTIEAVVRDAHHIADLVAAMLGAHDFKPVDPANDDSNEELDGALVERAKAMLLNLGAALRIREWEKNGQKDYIPEPLPSSSEAVQAIVPAEGTDGATATDTYSKVFQASMRHFALRGRAELGVDVLLDRKGFDEEQAIDALADFLWEHRELVYQEEDS